MVPILAHIKKKTDRARLVRCGKKEVTSLTSLTCLIWKADRSHAVRQASHSAQRTQEADVSGCQRMSALPQRASRLGKRDGRHAVCVLSAIMRQPPERRCQRCQRCQRVSDVSWTLTRGQRESFFFFVGVCVEYSSGLFLNLFGNLRIFFPYLSFTHSRALP